MTYSQPTHSIPRPRRPGFTVETTPSGWTHLNHSSCGQWTSLLDPTPDTLKWYMATHRCGPDVNDWHGGDPELPEHAAESPGVIAAWLRDAAHYVAARPTGLLTDATVWPAVQELAEVVDDLFLVVETGGER